MNRLFSPLDVQIELTEGCNQVCRHCYNYWRKDSKAPSGELALDDFLIIVRQIHLARVGSVTLTGGEPMLRKELLFGLIPELQRLDIDVGLNSNGVLIDRESAGILAKSGLKHALISVLGPETVHNSIAGPGGSFVGTINGIKNLLDSGIDVAVNMPVSKANLAYLRETAILIRNVGVSKFCSGPIVPSCKTDISLCLSAEECKTCLRGLIGIGSDLSLTVAVLEPLARCLFRPEEDAEFIRFFGNRICSAAVSSCAISSRGDMRPCIHSDVIYGNVLPDKFLDVWNKMGEWASPEILPEKCIACNALMVCEGGCRMSAKNTTGRYNGPDMYMTEPISDPERAILMPQVDSLDRLGYEDLFEFNKRCIIRKEQQGYVLCAQGRLEYLTLQGFSFISLIRQFESFSLCLLVKETGHSVEMLEPVIQRLVLSGVINRKEVKVSC